MLHVGTTRTYVRSRRQHETSADCHDGDDKRLHCDELGSVGGMLKLDKELLGWFNQLVGIGKDRTFPNLSCGTKRKVTPNGRGAKTRFYGLKMVVKSLTRWMIANRINSPGHSSLLGFNLDLFES